MFCYRSEQNADFEEAAGLRRIGAARSEDQPRRRAGCPDMGKLDARKEYLVLVGWCHGYRPRVAARPVEQVRRAIGQAARAGDVLETHRQADTSQRGAVAKAVIEQHPSTSRRGGRQRTDRRDSWDVSVLKAGCEGPRFGNVDVDQIQDCLVVLEQRGCQGRLGCMRVIAARGHGKPVRIVERVGGRTP